MTHSLLSQHSFLKWAGGKYALREKIITALPAGKRLIEPFFGAGAIFLNSNYSEYLLAEINPDLINLFQFLQTEGTDFIEEARTYFTPENNCVEQYILFRQAFNDTLNKSTEKKKTRLFISLSKSPWL